MDKLIIKKAKQSIKSGAHILHLIKNTSARVAKSRKYKAGEVVMQVDHWKPLEAVVFLTSIRWENRVGQSYGGYLVMGKKGNIFTTTGVGKL